MKLLCETNVIRRSNREIKGRFLKSTLAIGKKDEKSKLCIILITSSNKTGIKYDLTNNLAGIFRKFVDEGKCTISFVLPEVDLQIKADSIQLKAFLNVMKNELCPPKDGQSKDLGKNDNKLIRAFGSTNKMMNDEVTKLNITKRSEFPIKGFPRTLKELHITGVGCLQMPIGILNLAKLTHLDLTSNKIEKLHKAVGNLNINQLILTDNLLGKSTNLKDWEWLNGRNIQLSLHTFIISRNKLKMVPVSVAKCEKLVCLDLSFNELLSVPFSIKQLRQLKTLNLNNNELKSLPCTIRSLYLDLIDLSTNQFPSYTESLELSQNSLSNITSHNFKFPTLFELSSRCVMRQQIPFMSLNIPHIIKEILYHSPNCSKCGSLCFDRTIYKNINFVSLNAKTRITTDNSSYFLIDGPLCKYSCLNSK
ncbi:leucine-rich repeat protein 1 [Chironomus tepperi]|uniref:leucine-rich repeat protein 1 n=1 Tax=Chironomus tepperi TaxID=113505 RepID=UPI00391F4ADF